MKFKVMYRFNLGGNSKSAWYFHSEHDDMLDAKRTVKGLKKHLGQNGSVKIETIKEGE